MNRLKTFLLMLLLTAIFLLLGHFIAGQEGLIIAFILALAMNFFSYWFSDRIAISMTRSRPLSESEAPGVYRALRELTYNANMPMPRVYLMPTDQPNAFATGRNPENAVIAVTAGLLRMLDYEELKGVLGHELAHIRNRDILIGSIAGYCRRPHVRSPARNVGRGFRRRRQAQRRRRRGAGPDQAACPGAGSSRGSINPNVYLADTRIRS